MWTDYESQQDYLNYSEMVENISDLIRSPEMLPVSIGVYGNWGSGKSTVLELLRQDIAENDFLIINYDAWLFQGFDDAKASMMEAITENVSSSIKDNETLAAKAGNLLKRVNYLRLFGMAAKTGISLATGSVLPLAGSGLVSASKLLSGDGEKEDGDNIVAAVGSAGGLLKPIEETSPTEEICKFRAEFSELLKEMGKTVVVFVDNLDRCLPDTAIGILEAIHLFLFLPNTAFVIAADRDMVKQAVAKYYTEFSPISDHVSNYLDKIIQVPLRVPMVGVQELKAYMYLLFISKYCESDVVLEAQNIVLSILQESWKGIGLSRDALTEVLPTKVGLDNQLDMADRLAPILANAPHVNGNPRTVKRMLNDLELRIKVATARQMQLDEGVLAKLIVFERCVDDRAFRKLVSLVVSAEKGAPKILADLENERDFEKFKDKLPDGWQGDEKSSFIYEWFGTDPRLSDVDLRGAMYLARDTMPFYEQTHAVPRRVTETARAFLSVTSVSSGVVKRLLLNLSTNDQLSLMGLLIGKFRRNSQWSRPVSGIYGAIALANTNTECANLLGVFLVSLPERSLGAWIEPLVKRFDFYAKLVIQKPVARVKRKGA